MKPIPFRANPGFVTAGEALELAVSHLAGNAMVWIVPVVLYAVVTGGVGYAFGTSIAGDLIAARGDPDAVAVAASAVLARLPALVGSIVLVILGSIALGWLVTALAVGGLPGRNLSLDDVFGAGLRSVLLGLLAVLVGVAILALAVLLVVAIGRSAALLLVVLIPVAIVAYLYAILRLMFATFAIFDGAGVIESLRISWAISSGAVLRIFGWVLLLAAVGIGVSIAAGIAGAAFAFLPVLGAIVSSLLTATMQVYQGTTMGILYESERIRHGTASPARATMPAGPLAVDPGARDATGVGPLLPPPPPAW